MTALIGLLAAVFLLAAVHGQIVAYTLTYSSVDCSGTAGMFQAMNQSTCTPAACTLIGTGSQQGFCHAGTLESLANPVVCPGCAYCGTIGYVTGSNCDPNSWVTSTVERLGICINARAASIIAYGCTSLGQLMNSTQYSDAACTVAGPIVPFRIPACTSTEPECRSTFPVTEGICSYTNLFNGGGGGGQNGTHGTASTQTVSLLFLATLIWATL